MGKKMQADTENTPEIQTSDEGQPADRPGTLSLTSAQLAERMERATASAMRANFGTKDVSSIKERLERLEQFEAGEQERKRAALSEQERMAADLSEARAMAAASQASASAAAFDAKMVRLCATEGIKNVDYAIWELSRRAGDVKDGEQFDPSEYLRSIAKTDSGRAALGLAPFVVVQDVGITSAPKIQEPSGDQARPERSARGAFDLDAKAWALKKASLGIG